METDRGVQAILDQIRKFMVYKATPLIPDGYKLTFTFTDIDLAGEFEPWRGPQWDSVRIIKPIYAPAFRFEYSVSDASGRVVKHGGEFIRDMAFQFRPAMDLSDPLRYEKSILEDWLRNHLADLKKR